MSLQIVLHYILFLLAVSSQIDLDRVSTNGIYYYFSCAVYYYYYYYQGDIDLCAGDPNDGIDSDCSASDSGKQVVVGICAMAKKAQSKPMTEILTRLREFDYIHLIVFEEDVILKVSQIKMPFILYDNSQL